MANIIDSMSKLPKWAIIVVGGVLIAGVSVGFYYLNFGKKDKKEEVVDTSKILLDMPDAPEGKNTSSALEIFQNQDRSSRVADYWDNLGGDEDVPTMPGTTSAAGGGAAGGGDDALDPAIYSEYDRYMIKNGVKTKAEVDAEKALEMQREEERQRQLKEDRERFNRPAARQLTQAQQDSLYFARLEKAYALAAKYATPEAAPGEPEAAAAPEEEERKLDLEDEKEEKKSVLPSDAFSDDGIVTSLDMPSENGLVSFDGKFKAQPVKATFLKNETLTNGNRVIIRLMQDLILSDGTRIPANTHITGICNFGRRLKINITSLHYGGRIFPVDISVYDNDGTEGIYCPTVEASAQKMKKAKKVAGDIVQSAGSVAGMMITGNPFVGRIAQTGLQAATSSVNSDGTVSVSVTSGYEFFVFENVKQDNNS